VGRGRGPRVHTREGYASDSIRLSPASLLVDGRRARDRPGPGEGAHPGEHWARHHTNELPAIDGELVIDQGELRRLSVEPNCELAIRASGVDTLVFGARVTADMCGTRAARRVRPVVQLLRGRRDLCSMQEIRGVREDVEEEAESGGALTNVEQMTRAWTAPGLIFRILPSARAPNLTRRSERCGGTAGLATTHAPEHLARAPAHVAQEEGGT